MEQNTRHKLSNRRQDISLLVFCVFAMLIFTVFSSYLKTFQRNQINSDVVEYYSFIPAAFECHDLSFTSDCPKFYWAQTTPDGKRVNKRSIGMAYMYLPFYGLSQGISSFKGKNDDGYSLQTQKMLVYGMWIYVIIGLFFLGKALYYFFNSRAVLTTLTILILSTNLIWYTNGEPLFSHGVNFMWFSLLIYSTIKYHQQYKLWPLILISISCSMLTVIRPNNLLLALFPVIYGIYDKESLVIKWSMIKRNYPQLMLASVVFLIPIVPQLMYWKFATGNWIYYSYQGEKFFWDRPWILDVLFSFRKGWLVYTPVMILSIIGMVVLKKSAKQMVLPVIFIFLLFLYVTSCWWAWSYGGCFGMRPMIDVYPLLAFPLAALISVRKWYLWIPVYAFIIATGWLNIFQAGQYREGILHYDQMNKDLYLSIWRRTKYPNDYDLKVSYPDYMKELNGTGSFYQLSDLSNSEFTMKFIRAKFVCSIDSTCQGVSANHEQAHSCDSYIFVYNSFEKKYAIRSVTSRSFWKLNKETYFIDGNEPDILRASLFEIIPLGYNKFALKAPNGFYITSTENNMSRLKADALEINPNSYVVIRSFNH